MKLWCVCLVVLGVSVPVAAQPAGAERPRPARGEGRDELFRMMDAYVLTNLQERLALTDEQYVKLLPLVKRARGDRRELAQKRFRALEELRATLEAGGATESRITELLKELKAMEAEEQAANRRNMEALDAALSPIQQAKFRVLEGHVEARFRQLMQDIRQQGGRPGARRRPEGGSPR